MSDTSGSTDKQEELERVELKGRTSRGVVISVRLTSPEATAVAEHAKKSGVSVSEYARRALRNSLAGHWQLRVWDGMAALSLAVPPNTGGDYAHTDTRAIAAT
jgi:Mobilization protein NikA